MQAEDKVNIFNINDGGKLLHLLKTVKTSLDLAILCQK